MDSKFTLTTTTKEELFIATTTKKELFRIAYEFAMLQADENELEAFKILENEKDLLRHYTR
jgi:hypothetical protein